MPTKIYETAKIVSPRFTIGEDCLIGDFAFVAARKLIMKDGSQISPYAIIGGGGEVVLGKFSVVGFGAMLFPATDSTYGQYMCEAAPTRKREVIRGSINLGEGAYIGAGAVVCVSRKCETIEIGDYAVVGALTYVDRCVPAYTVIHPKTEYVEKKRASKSFARVRS